MSIRYDTVTELAHSGLHKQAVITRGLVGRSLFPKNMPPNEKFSHRGTEIALRKSNNGDIC